MNRTKREDTHLTVILAVWYDGCENKHEGLLEKELLLLALLWENVSKTLRGCDALRKMVDTRIWPHKAVLVPSVSLAPFPLTSYSLCLQWSLCFVLVVTWFVALIQLQTLQV